MMGPNTLGEVSDMLTLCDRVPEDISGNIMLDWTKEVVVTGFKGSFEGTPDDVSSVIIDELQKVDVENRILLLIKLDASYEEVMKKIPELFTEHQDFVLHLASYSEQNKTTIFIEQKAFMSGYTKPDKNEFIPEGNRVKSESKEQELVTKVNVDDLVKELTEKCGLNGQKYGGLTVEKSEDPGRFIEGYTYFLSLDANPSSRLLVKIPAFQGECTKEAVASVIRELIIIATRSF
ncbi:hypothetical protein CRE_20783 [Caenorhabditis remanei]|uniref:Uncharacterized protein n=1 Tax=Caenorhabditis remanei TaxID=31234 RepID=E3MFJ5_CAERE|nr:hypothetical protein CRE_20783 [Caenorhabditis remanei]